MDPRWQKLGDLLVNYATGVQPGERVLIGFMEPETFPLLKAVYAACIQAGAFPQVLFQSEALNRQLLLHGSPEQIGWMPELEALGMEWADVYLGLRGAHNPAVFWDIPSSRLADLRQSMGKISTLRWQKTRWCLLRVPNAALAQQAGVDEDSLLEMFFDACLLDWPTACQEWQRRAERLGQGRRVRVVGLGTDLSFSVAGRSWMVGDGRINLPDGEIATSPDETSLDGQITFENPGVMAGRLMENIRLRWQQGKLIEAECSTNQDFFQSLLQTDPGASRIGEFAFGVNPGLKFFCQDILLDEKIDGTIHIALGRAYPQTGGTNQSALHWDIVKDMRQQGEIYLDERLIYQKGKFQL